LQKKRIYLFSTSTHPDAININSLSIKLLKPQIDFSKYDYLLLTSKQAINALKQYDSKEYLQKEALCISQKTASFFEEVGGVVLEIGDGYGDNLSEKIKNYPKSIKWLYIRAKEVATDFATICKNSGYYIDEVVGYESLCSQEILRADIEKESVLIFTSPSSVRCFLKTHSIDKSSKVIVIGKTTAKALPNGTDFSISKQKSIESCIEIAKTI
jgi:uroporphyrinogen-III synthase